MLEWKFRVYGVPIAKGRARVITKGGKTWGYTPSNTKAWEEAIVLQIKSGRPEEPLQGPLGLTLGFYLPKPKKPKCKFPIIRPDKDNLEKSVMDAMKTAGFYKDDCQIVDGRCSKQYALGKDEIGVYIHLWEVDCGQENSCKNKDCYTRKRYESSQGNESGEIKLV